MLEGILHHRSIMITATRGVTVILAERVLLNLKQPIPALGSLVVLLPSQMRGGKEHALPLEHKVKHFKIISFTIKCVFIDYLLFLVISFVSSRHRFRLPVFFNTLYLNKF